ncbi:hypothetical protein BH10PSE17_BH10PSE17_22630 [soil metagenome]
MNERRISASLTRASLVAAIVLTLALIWGGGVKGTGSWFVGIWHDIEHLGAFGLFTLLWCLALPRVPVILVAMLGVSAGIAHEAWEIVGHVHAFEWDDAIVDGIGAVLGAVMGGIIRVVVSNRIGVASRG